MHVTPKRITAAGRSPLYLRGAAGPSVLRRREDLLSSGDELNHTGAHKINNCARPAHCWPGGWARSGSSRRPAPASTVRRRRPWRSPVRPGPASSHTGATDIERQAPKRVPHEAYWARKVLPVTLECSCTLKDAHERGAARLGRPTSRTTFYIIGTAAGPHPYPAPWCANFQSVIGDEVREQTHGGRGAAAGQRWWPASAAAPNATGLSCTRSSTTRLVRDVRRRGGRPRRR